MTNASDSTRWSLRPDVVCTVLNDGAVILDLRSKFFFSANAGGWAICQMLETGATHDEVLAACARWGAGEADTAAIKGLLDLLAQEQLIEPAAGPALPGGDIPLAVWIAPTLIKHKEPLQRVMVSAFDPGLPLAE